MSGGGKITDRVPHVVVLRLPLYSRTLALLEQERVEVVSSRELGTRLQITPAQIRKDLSYFGRFGRQGRGYNVKALLKELHQILGLTREWSMAVVGVGRLGRAIVEYGGFAPQGFRVVAAFDNNRRLVGKKVGGLTIQHLSEIEETIQRQKIDIGIVAVPAAEAQRVVDALIKHGIRAILNYAPVAPQVPKRVHLRQIDPVLSLQSITFYLKEGEAPR